MFPVKVDGTVLTLLVSGMLAGIAGIWRELRRGFTAESRVDTLTESVTELHAEVKSLRMDLEKANAKINDLRGAATVLEAQNAVLEETLRETRAEVKELRAQNKEIRSQRDKIAEELACVRDREGGGP